MKSAEKHVAELNIANLKHSKSLLYMQGKTIQNMILSGKRTRSNLNATRRKGFFIKIT